MAGIGELDTRQYSGAAPVSSLGDQLLKYGVQLQEQARLEEAEKARLEQQKFANTLALAAEERAKRAEAERVNDKEAAKTFNTVLAEGPQVSGGILNQPQLIAESDKYSMTPEEQKLAEKYRVDGLYSGDAARKAGNTVLADKLDWQNKMSNYSDNVVATGIGNESETELLKRAMKSVADKGLAPTDAMTLAIREAQLAEKEAQTAAEEKYTKSLDSDTKEMFSNLLTAGSANDSMLKRASGGSGIDLETGEAYGGGLQGGGNKNVEKVALDQHADLMTETEKLIGGKDLSDEVRAGITTQFINYLKTMSPEQAKIAALKGIGSNDPWWNLLGKADATYSTDKADALAKQAERVAGLFGGQGGATSTSGAGGILSSEKAQVAESIANYYKYKRTSSAEKLSLLDMTPEERRNSAILKGAREFGLLGDLTREGTGADTAKGTGLTSSGKAPKYVASLSAGIGGVPNSLVQSEAVTTEAYKDGKGYSIAMGYNLAANDKDIDNDFANAGISKEKAYIARTNPGKLVLTDDEAKRLSQVSTYKYMDQLDGNLKNWGVKGGFDSLSPQMQAIALQMRYRGDLSTSTKYGKDLINFVKNDDVKGIQNYVIENKDTLPAPVVARMQHNITFPETDPLRGTMTDKQKDAYLTKNKDSDVVKKILGTYKESTKEPDNNTKILNKSTNSSKNFFGSESGKISDSSVGSTQLIIPKGEEDQYYTILTPRGEFNKTMNDAVSAISENKPFTLALASKQASIINTMKANRIKDLADQLRNAAPSNEQAAMMDEYMELTGLDSKNARQSLVNKAETGLAHLGAMSGQSYTSVIPKILNKPQPVVNSILKGFHDEAAFERFAAAQARNPNPLENVIPYAERVLQKGATPEQKARLAAKKAKDSPISYTKDDLDAVAAKLDELAKKRNTKKVQEATKELEEEYHRIKTILKNK